MYIKAENKIHSYTSFEWERKRESALPPHSFTGYPITGPRFSQKSLVIRIEIEIETNWPFFFFFGLRYCG